MGEVDAFGPDRAFVERVAQALDGVESPADPHGSTLAQRHGQRFAWFAQTSSIEGGAAARLVILDLTGLTDSDVAHTPVEGPVRFGRNALELALTRRVGALHLDHAPWRANSWVGLETGVALSDENLAERFLGAPHPGPQLAARLSESYICATLRDAWGPGRHINLLVRRDLEARFRAAGFEL